MPSTMVSMVAPRRRAAVAAAAMWDIAASSEMKVATSKLVPLAERLASVPFL